jgi:hypothetical protein
MNDSDSGGEVDDNEIEKMKKTASLGKVLFIMDVFVFVFAFIVKARTTKSRLCHHHCRRRHLLKTTN